MRENNNNINLNTYLIGAVVAICGWTLTTVYGLSGDMRAALERDNERQREMMDLRTRLSALEVETVRLRLDFTKLEGVGGK